MELEDFSNENERQPLRIRYYPVADENVRRLLLGKIREARATDPNHVTRRLSDNDPEWNEYFDKPTTVQSDDPFYEIGHGAFVLLGPPVDHVPSDMEGIDLEVLSFVDRFTVKGVPSEWLRQERNPPGPIMKTVFRVQQIIKQKMKKFMGLAD